MPTFPFSCYRGQDYLLDSKNFWKNDVGLRLILVRIFTTQVLVKLTNMWLNLHINMYQQADDLPDN